MSELVMPRLGPDMDEGVVLRWLVAAGDEVSAGQPVVEIETDKAVAEIGSPSSGWVTDLLAAEGQTVPVGTPIAIIGRDRAPARVVQPSIPAVEPAWTTMKPAPPTMKPGPPTRRGRTPASPLARRLATERGIDLSHVAGTGDGGLVTADDVRRFAES